MMESKDHEVTQRSSGVNKADEIELDACNMVEHAETPMATDQHRESEISPQCKAKLLNYKFIMTLIGLGMAFVASQVQPLLFAAILPFVAADLDAASKLVWFLCAQQVAIGVSAPFAGPFADFFGRKAITITGTLLSMVGMILAAATPNSVGFLAAQALSGVGIAIQELVAIAAVAEIVPTSQRGYYVAIVVLGFLPFAPSSLYGALIAKANWRFCAATVAIWNSLTAIVLSIFYSPPPRTNSRDLTTKQKLGYMDFVGGVLLTCGLVILLVGINSGGQPYAWGSPRIISLLTTGIALLCMFVLYEYFFAPHPMFPRRLLQHPRPFFALMTVILMAGINYIPLLFFWVIESVAIYDSTVVEVGIRTLPFGFCIIAGAIISAVLVSMFKCHVRLIMTSFCAIQAIAIACMAAVDKHDISTAWAPLTIGLTAIGGVLIPNQIIITIIAPDDLIGTATSLTVCVRAIGQVIGISVFYNRFLKKVTSGAIRFVLPAAFKLEIYDVNALVSLMHDLVARPFSAIVSSLPELNTPERWATLQNATISAFGGAFTEIYLISIAFGAMASVASLFIGDLAPLIDEHIAVDYF